MSPRTHRRKAREIAMQALFQYDRNPDTRGDFIRTYVAEELKFPELEEFCLAIIEGTRSHWQAIDERIEKAAVNWKLERMAPVDRAILRLGTYEIAFAVDPTPARVVISEAVEIAKRFSSADAPRFINGVLDAVAKQMGDTDTTDPTASDPPPIQES